MLELVQERRLVGRQRILEAVHVGAAISFQAVALRAGVSRQWLYTQPALRCEIEQLRDQAAARTSAIPARQRATEASLRQRLETLRVKNQRLRDENHSLKAEVAIAYGQQRRDRLRPAARRPIGLTAP